MKPTSDGMPFSDILPPTPIINSRPVTILFLAANPTATTPLRLDEEVRAIEIALHRAEFRGHFRLEQHWAVRITEIQGLLLQYRPDIVHFSGHGNTNQELIFSDDVGNPQSVAPEAFGRLFALLKDNIRCVLLNACYSFVQAQAIAQHIDAVVGVSQAIGDQASIQFASAFYQAIGFGRSVKSAFDLGRSQIELTNLDGAQAPQLIALRSDPAQIGFVNYSHPLPSSVNDGHALRNRAAMLKLLADFWIDGVLKQSLYQEVLLDLGMQIREEAVHPHLWDMEVRPLRGTARRLSPSVRIGSVFEEMHRSLLILGEPGSGKTTMLLDLARVALVRADGDLAEPIPVVFNLASWTEQHLPITDWLVNELRVKYQIPERIALPWVANDDLMLLLDGLDQVAPGDQDECVKALNEYLDQHLVAVAVCCRVTEYDALPFHLNVRGVVVLQPLSTEQIQRFLAIVGLQQSSFATELLSDPILRQLAQSPLLLSVMTIACREMSISSSPSQVNQLDLYRRHIFDLYVQQMLNRRTSIGQYTTTQTLCWLIWLAKGMLRHGHVEFLIEQLQPTWLPHRSDRLIYEISVRAVSGLLFFVTCILAGALALVAGNITLAEGLTQGVIVGALFLVPYWLASIFVCWVPKWPAAGLTIGLTAVMTMPFAALGGTIGGIIISLVIGLPAALAGVTLAVNDSITPAERLSWSWKKASYGVALGLGAALIMGLSAALSGKVARSASDAFTAGLLVGPAATLMVGLTRSLSVLSTTKPNQGIRQSMRNAGFVAALVFIAVVSTGTVWGIVHRSSVSIGLSFGLIFALPIGLAAGFVQGGIPIIQHLVLRLLLFGRGFLPWNCSRFLDTAAERILLRKVGGSYIFVHPLLLDYFSKTAEQLDLQNLESRQ